MIHKHCPGCGATYCGRLGVDTNGAGVIDCSECLALDKRGEWFAIWCTNCQLELW